MKMLLYSCKAKPYLVDERKMRYHNFVLGDNSVLKSNEKDLVLNGKIVAECDFEVEEIYIVKSYGFPRNIEIVYTDSLRQPIYLSQKSCLKLEDICEYLNHKDGYAIHIKNLHIFDEPKELSDCLIHPKIEPKYYGCEHLSKAPQNMMYVELDDIKYILISIRPEWLCKILNGDKTIEIRKKVLKEMLE